MRADNGLVPFGEIQVEPLHGDYVGYGPDGLPVRSEDGLIWRRDTAAPGGGGGSYVRYHGSLALVSGADVFDVYEARNGSWVPVPTDHPNRDGVSGLRWMVWPWQPVESEGVSLIPVTALGTLMFEDTYGSSSSDQGCPTVGDCPVWWQWNGLRQEFTVHGPDDTVVAGPDVEGAGREIRLVDSETAAAVYVITFPDEAAADAYLEDLNRGASVSRQLLYVQEGARLSVLEAPWKKDSLVMAVPGGFVALESIEYPPGTLQGSPVTWLSSDGLNWSAAGSPDLLPERYDHVRVFVIDDKLVAQVALSPDPMAEVDEWVTSDGLVWTQREQVLPGDDLMTTDFGVVATSWGPGARMWVSADGESWEEVALPEPEESDLLHSMGGVGDLLYFQSVSPEGTAQLWIGRLAD